MGKKFAAAVAVWLNRPKIINLIASKVLEQHGFN
jgi:hypothetical protein